MPISQLKNISPDITCYLSKRMAIWVLTEKEEDYGKDKINGNHGT